MFINVPLIRLQVTKAAVESACAEGSRGAVAEQVKTIVTGLSRAQCLLTGVRLPQWMRVDCFFPSATLSFNLTLSAP